MTIVTRANLGRPLTWDELDGNFTTVQSLTTQAAASASNALTNATAASEFATSAANSATQAGAALNSLNTSLGLNNGLSKIGVCPDVATLRTLTGIPTGRKVMLLGYYATSPGVGGGILYASNNTTLNDDGVRVFVTSDGTRLIRETVSNTVLASQGGAVSGSGNDTEALTRLAASRLNVIVDGDYTIVDATIHLMDAQKWSGEGSIRQVCVTTNPAPENPSVWYPPSSYPLVNLANGSRLHDVTLYPAFEGVTVDSSSECVNTTIYGEGRTYYDGILCFGDNTRILRNKVYDVGQWLNGITYAPRGDAIFISNSSTQTKNVMVKDNTMRGAAKNGLLVIGTVNSLFTGNLSIANRMSAFQIAFINDVALISNGLIFKSNAGVFNGADSFDVNNSSGLSVDQCDVSTTIEGNTFTSNGWIYPTRAQQISRSGSRLETPDGAGLTLINVRRLFARGNQFTDNAKACVYASNILDCEIKDNSYVKLSSHSTDDTDGFRLHKVISSVVSGNKARIPKVAFRFSGGCTDLVVERNHTFSNTSGSDGVVNAESAPSFKFCDNTVEIINGNFISGYSFQHSGCLFKASVAGSVVYSGLTYGDLSKNTYYFTQGSIQFLNCSSLRIDSMEVDASTTSSGGAVNITGLSGTCSITNSRIVQRGITAALLFQGGGSFSVNIVGGHIVNTNGSSANNIKVLDGVAGMVIRTDNIDLSTGIPDFTGATRQQIPWA